MSASRAAMLFCMAVEVAASRRNSSPPETLTAVSYCPCSMRRAARISSPIGRVALRPGTAPIAAAGRRRRGGPQDPIVPVGDNRDLRADQIPDFLRQRVIGDEPHRDPGNGL